MFAVITITVVVIFITIIISLLPHSHPQTSAYGESFASLLISSANSHLQASVIKLCPPPGVLPLPSAPAKTQPILLDSAQIPAWASPRPPPHTHTPPRPSQNPQPSDFPDHMTYFPNPARHPVTWASVSLVTHKFPQIRLLQALMARGRSPWKRYPQSTALMCFKKAGPTGSLPGCEVEPCVGCEISLIRKSMNLASESPSSHLSFTI